MTSAQVELVLRRIERGRYVLEGSDTPAELRMSGWRSRGQAIVGGHSYSLQRTGFFSRGVSAFDASGEQRLRLARKDPLVPPLPDCTWKVRARLRGYQAKLESPSIGSMAFRVGHGGRSDVVVQVIGSWPQRDLIVLTGAFAVLLRRRQDTEAAAGAAASTAATS